ncbi:MAG: hypothetical protein NXI29_05535 [bacterium]|nr:hypothetical protein [bacterium]
MFESRIAGDRGAMRSVLAAIYTVACQKLVKPSEIRFSGEETEEEGMTEEQAISLFVALGACSGR